MLDSYGRADQLDLAAIERLIIIAALSRLLGSDTTAGGAAAGMPGLASTCSRPLGGTSRLHQLWRTLGIDTSLQRPLAGTRRPEGSTERVPFALVANRALAPLWLVWVSRRGRRGLGVPRRGRR